MCAIDCEDCDDEKTCELRPKKDDVGEQLIELIIAKAKELGMIIQSGQYSNGEEGFNLVTPDRELITVIRNFAPDEETLEAILA